MFAGNALPRNTACQGGYRINAPNSEKVSRKLGLTA